MANGFDPASAMETQMTAAPAGGFNVSAGQMYAVAGLINAYGASQAQQAQAINQQTAYLVQARDTLAVAEVRADLSEQYATIQAGRMLKRADMEAMNYKIAGNTLLRNLRKTNAAARARAAASGVALGEGSIQGIQTANVQAVMRDVDIAELNALTAQVLGFEDASAMLQSTELQSTLNLFQARRQAGGLESAAATTRRTGGLLAGATLTQGLIGAARTF
jgi:hypothetical protein